MKEFLWRCHVSMILPLTMCHWAQLLCLTRNYGTMLSRNSYDTSNTLAMCSNRHLEEDLWNTIRNPSSLECFGIGTVFAVLSLGFGTA